MKKPMQDMMQKDRFDDLFTPREAVWDLLNHVTIPTGSRIWEPCDPGGSQITDVLRKTGLTVVSTDLKTGEDFLTSDFLDFDIIITNPPYSQKTKFLKRCFELGYPFALLLPTTTLEGKVRGRMFKEHPIHVIFPDHRYDYTGKKRPWFHTSWFTYKMVKNETQLIFV